MATEVKKPMSVVLASNGITELCKSLSLTPSQITNAKSRALALSSDEKLKNCDPFSIAKFCFESARYNFTRDDCIYAVPYGNKIQAQFGYKAYREQALQAGYSDVNCVEVYECDKVYRDTETGQVKVLFEQDVKKTMGAKIIGYYAYAKDNNGVLTNALYWDVDKVTRHGKHYSKTYSSVWGDEFGFGKMAKKTLIKQLCNELRSTPLLQDAIKQDQIVFGGENESDAYLDNPNARDTTSTETTNVSNDIIDIDDEKADKIA